MSDQSLLAAGSGAPIALLRFVILPSSRKALAIFCLKIAARTARTQRSFALECWTRVAVWIILKSVSNADLSIWFRREHQNKRLGMYDMIYCSNAGAIATVLSKEKGVRALT